MIHIPLEIGDIILTGKFKNKKVTVKEFGIDKHGLPTVNGRGIMNIRIPKLMKKEEQKIRVPKLKDIYRESSEQLKPGTRVLFIKGGKLTPGVIDKFHKNDWYWVKDDSGHREVLKLDSQAKANRSFEIVVH